MSMRPEQIRKSSKKLIVHFRAKHEQLAASRKDRRRTDFMRASHKAYLQRKAASLQSPLSGR